MGLSFVFFQEAFIVLSLRTFIVFPRCFYDDLIALSSWNSRGCASIRGVFVEVCALSWCFIHGVCALVRLAVMVLHFHGGVL